MPCPKKTGHFFTTHSTKHTKLSFRAFMTWHHLTSVLQLKRPNTAVKADKYSVYGATGFYVNVDKQLVVGVITQHCYQT